LDDSPFTLILDVIAKSFEFLDKARDQGENVLVHCNQGVSRSGAIVVAYAMKTNKITFEVALDLVRRIRSVIRPNPGFIDQILLLEAMKFDLEGDTIYHYQYRLMKIQHLRKCKELTGSNLNSFNRRATSSLSARSRYNCRNCHALLFSSAELLPKQVINFVQNQITLTEDLENSHRLFPMAWMIPIEVVDEEEGELLCPGCQSIIGTFDWESMPPEFRIKTSCVSEESTSSMDFEEIQKKIHPASSQSSS
jgi:dual specificity phosphatase 12